jgi:hypothetical protein
MTMTDSPITPPPELVAQWFLSAKAMPVDQWVTDVATQAAQWGADQELEACCEWVGNVAIVQIADNLRAARRPKPPSLKEQALHELEDVYNRDKIEDSTYDTIRRALEALDD